MRHPKGSDLIRRSSLALFLALAFLGEPLRAKVSEEAPPDPARSTAASQATEVQAPVAPAAQEKDQGQARSPKKPDVIFVPTPQAVVDKMLELAEVKAGDVLYDLGCGDGRIVVTAAKRYGIKATGFDIDPERIQESRDNVRKSGVEDRVTITQGDLFEADLNPASVVTLYLLPTLNVRLMPKLRSLKPGTRIVSHDFDMKGAKPTKVVTVRTDDDDENGEHMVYLWVVPWEEEKP
jgi:SAM-dependent methyltransferase